MQFCEQINNIKGILSITATHADTKELLYKYTYNNVITYAGRKVLNFSIANKRSLAVYKYIALGDGAYLPNQIDLTTPPPEAQESDISLKREILRKEIVIPIYHTTELSSVMEVTLGPEEGIGYYFNEFGLILSDNTLFARRTTLPIAKISRMLLTITWTILF